MMQLSKRALGIQPSATLAIDEQAKAMKAKGYDVIGFGAGEPDFDTPSFIREACKKALDAGATRYTPVAGTLDLRKAICEKLLLDNNLTYTPDQIVVSNGAKHSLYNVFQSILNDGDEVIIPTPCWVSYPEMVRMAGGVPVFVNGYEKSEFKPAIADIAAAVTSRTRAFILNSPNNPNGYVYSHEELQALAKLAIERDFVIVSDEIYEVLCFDGNKPLSIAALSPEAYERTIVVNGVSKAYAMTGWRIGYTASPAPLAKAMTNMQSHSTSSPASMTQAAAVAALRGPTDEMYAMKAEFDNRRKLIVLLINQVAGLSCRMPAGAFYVMLNIKGILGKRIGDVSIDSSATFATQLLSESKVAVVPGTAFEAEGYCRLSYATSITNIEEGLRRIADFVSKLH